MENKSKAIILDMDETLEHGIFQGIYDVGDKYTMILRPNLDLLISKLKEVKKQGVDIILCTTAREEWVQRFFKLKPEFKNLFDKIYTRNNENEWRDFSKEKYQLEYKAKNENINLEYSKPITTFGYNQILFIDNSKIEELRLKILFEITKGKLEKDVTFFSAFGFYGGSSNWKEILKYRELAETNRELYKKLYEYIEIEKNEPCCNMMCSAIEEFVNKKFKAGLTLVDKTYLKEYEIFSKEISVLKEQLKELSSNLEEEIIDDIDSKLKQLLSKDKNYPYEEIIVGYK